MCARAPGRAARGRATVHLFPVKIHLSRTHANRGGAGGIGTRVRPVWSGRSRAISPTRVNPTDRCALASLNPEKPGYLRGRIGFGGRRAYGLCSLNAKCSGTRVRSNAAMTAVQAPTTNRQPTSPQQKTNHVDPPPEPTRHTPSGNAGFEAWGFTKGVLVNVNSMQSCPYCIGLTNL